MRATVNSDGTFSVEVEAEQVKDLFESIAEAQEVFGNLTVVGKVDGKTYTSNKVVLSVREDNDDNKYYEAVCMEDGPLKFAKKKFGCHKKGGGLFPKGNWVKWDKDQKCEVDIMTGVPVVKEKE